MAFRTQTRQKYKDAVYSNLEQCITLHTRRNQNPTFKAHVLRVSQYQTERIQHTYDDCMQLERYGLALNYFKDDLYSAKDYSSRGHDIKKIYPIIERIMPNRLFNILAHIMELNALSMDLDERQTTALIDMHAIDRITQENYAHAFRTSASKEERIHQIDLMLSIGTELDSLMGKNYLGGVLKLSNTPAHALGLGNLHGFLSRGYTAFMKMDGAEPLINVIFERENAILDAIFSGAPNPFNIDKNHYRPALK